MQDVLNDIAAAHEGRRLLLIGHTATRWALDHLLLGVPLEELVGPFDWQPGWRYSLRDDGGSEIAPGCR